MRIDSVRSQVEGNARMAQSEQQQEIKVDAVVAHLEQQPNLRARDIATALDVSRRALNQLLHSRIDRFVKDPEDHSWRVRDDSASEPLERSPGPFGPAAALIPSNQKLKIVPQTASCHHVQQLILENDFSAIPVENDDGALIGIATLESIAEHLQRVRHVNTSLANALDAPIRHACESVRYIGPETFIDLQVNWHDVQHVIVGTRHEPIGILTLADVWAVLHQFTEAFVLIHEIEIGLRFLITRHIASSETSIEQLLESMHIPEGANRPSNLEEMNFSQYIYLIYSSIATPVFEPLLGARAIFRASFESVNRIRNDVMHFRNRERLDESIDTLRSFRMTVRG